MSLILDELKKVLAQEPAAFMFYGARCAARIIDGKAHALLGYGCDIGGSAQISSMTLKEILGLDYSHGCFEKAYFQLSAHCSETPLSLLELLKLLDQMPSPEDVTKTNLNPEGFKIFLKLLQTKFLISSLDDSPYASEKMLKYLKLKKGCPANAREIMDIFAAQTLKTQESRSLRELSASFAQEKKGQMVLIYAPGTFSVYSELTHRGSSLESVTAQLMLAKYQVDGTTLICAPLSLEPILKISRSLQVRSVLTVVGEPSSETLLTVNALMETGMRLAGAWKSANSLG